MYEPRRIAIDASGQVWVLNGGDKNSVSKFSSLGVALSPSTGYTGVMSVGLGMAIDGAGQVWIVSNNMGYGSITEFSNAGVMLSPSTGFTGIGLYQPSSIAVDGSGNVWVPGGVPYYIGTTVFIGAAAPVVTPLAAGVKNNTLGTRP